MLVDAGVAFLERWKGKLDIGMIHLSSQQIYCFTASRCSGLHKLSDEIAVTLRNGSQVEKYLCRPVDMKLVFIFTRPRASPKSTGKDSVRYRYKTDPPTYYLIQDYCLLVKSQIFSHT